MEFESIALEKAYGKAEWLKNLIDDLPICEKQVPSMSILCDSQATIVRLKNKIFNNKSIHTRIWHSIVRCLLENQIVSLNYIRSELNFADPLTKLLNRTLVKVHRGE